MPLDAASIPPAPDENAPCEPFHESADTLALLAKRRSTKVVHFAEPGPSSADIDQLIASGAVVQRD